MYTKTTEELLLDLFEFMKSLFLNQLPPLTFTATYYNSSDFSRSRVEKDTVHFKNLLDGYVLGNQYKKHKTRLPGYIVIEEKKDGDQYNLHGCIQYYNPEQFMEYDKEAIECCWYRSIDCGTIDIESAYELNDWVDYTIKGRSEEGDISDAVHLIHYYDQRYYHSSNLLAAIVATRGYGDAESVR